MAKDKLTDYDSTASGNLDVGGISVAEGMLPSGVNNAIRELMSHQADAFGAGTPLYVDQTNNRLGIGTSTPDFKAEIVGGTNDGLHIKDAESATVFGGLFTQASNMTLVARSNHDLTFGTNDTERWRINTAGHMVPANTNNGIILGSTASVASNLLNDYEEGTWTPAFQASVANPTIASQGNSTGRYVKIGNIVHFWFYDSGTNITNAGSGFASVGGLPYTAESGYYPAFQFLHGTSFATGSSGGYVSAGTTSCIFIQRDSISVVNWATGTTYMMISGTYRTA